MTNAAAYYRVSTRRQEKEGFSLPAQRARAAEWAEAHDLTLTPEREWQDAETGTKAGREHYQDMLAAAIRGEFSVLLIRDISRFGRDEWETMSRIGQMIGLGLTLHEIKTSDTNHEARIISRDEAAAFILTAVGAMSAGTEVRQIRRNTRQGQQFATAKGTHIGRRPLGFQKVDKHLVPLDPEVVVVRQMYAWYAKENLSDHAITKRLNASRTLGKVWHTNTVRMILKNPLYRGETHWGATTLSVPAIVDEELWQQASARRATKAALTPRAQSSTYLLTGIIRCGDCGYSMVGRRGMPGTKLGRAYQCSRTLYGACPQRTRYDADELEETVIGALEGHVTGQVRPLTETAAEDVARIEGELVAAIAQRATIERNRTEQVRGALLGLRAIVEDTAEELLAEQDTAIVGLRAALALAYRRADAARTLSQLRSVREGLEGAPVPQQKALLQQMVDSATVYADARGVEIRLIPSA